MNDKWIVVFRGTKPLQAGPFPSREEAATWADRTYDEDVAQGDTPASSWDVQPVTNPDTYMAEASARTREVLERDMRRAMERDRATRRKRWRAWLRLAVSGWWPR